LLAGSFCASRHAGGATCSVWTTKSSIQTKLSYPRDTEMRPIVSHPYPASPRLRFVSLWRNRELILQLTRREVLSRWSRRLHAGPTRCARVRRRFAPISFICAMSAVSRVAP
jgi:hypothetical protein